MEFDDLQNQIFIPPLFLVRNGEGAEINGLEIEGALAATENLSFNFGMTLLDTSFDDGTNLGAGKIIAAYLVGGQCPDSGVLQPG